MKNRNWKLLFIFFLIIQVVDLYNLLTRFSLLSLYISILGLIELLAFFCFIFDKYLLTRKLWFYYFIGILIIGSYNLIAFLLVAIKNNLLSVGMILILFLIIFGFGLNIFVSYSLSQGKTIKDIK